MPGPGVPQGFGAAPAQPHGGYGPPPGGTAVWPGTAPAPIRRNNRRPLAIIGIVLVLAVVAGVVFLVIPPGATSAVGDAATEARGWSGVTYRGPVRGPAGDPVTVDMTVGTTGDKSGTLTRAGGGRAEFAEVGGVQLLRGNAAWWTGTPQGVDKGRRLAGLWLRNPSPETTWLGPLPLLGPQQLADDLAGPAGGPTPEYTDAGDQVVDGVDGRVVTVPERRLVLSDDRDARLLSVVPAEATDPAGLRVSAAAPEQLATLGGARSTLSGARDYAQTLYFPDDVEVEINAPACSTPTCQAFFKLVNTGGLEARGVVTITQDGRQINRFPFTIAPKGTANFTTTSPNAAIAAGRENVTTRYEATVTGS